MSLTSSLLLLSHPHLGKMCYQFVLFLSHYMQVVQNIRSRPRTLLKEIPMQSHSIDIYMADHYTPLSTTRRGRASRRWCRGTGRGGCRASRGRCAVVSPRHTYGRVVGRDRTIDAGDR